MFLSSSPSSLSSNHEQRAQEGSDSKETSPLASVVPTLDKLKENRERGEEMNGKMKSMLGVLSRTPLLKLGQ